MLYILVKMKTGFFNFRIFSQIPCMQLIRQLTKQLKYCDFKNVDIDFTTVNYDVIFWFSIFTVFEPSKSRILSEYQKKALSVIFINP